MKKHRLIIFCVLFALILNISAGAVTATDLETLSPAGKEAYFHVSELGIINGYDDGTFRGANAVSRREFLAMLCRTCGSSGVPTAGTFTDVDVQDWSADYVQWAYEQGIVSGAVAADGLRYFYPLRSIRTVEAVKMVLSALGYEAQAEGFVNDPAWEANVMDLAESLGLLNSLTVRDAMTREDAAILFHAALSASPVSYIDGAAVPANITWELQLIAAKDGGSSEDAKTDEEKPAVSETERLYGSRVFLFDEVVMQVYSGSSNTYTLQLIDLWGKTTQVTYTTDPSVRLPDPFDPVLVTFADNQWTTIAHIEPLSCWDLGQTSYSVHNTYSTLQMSGDRLMGMWISDDGRLHADTFRPEQTFLLAVTETDGSYHVESVSAAGLTVSSRDRLISVEFGKYMLLIALAHA